MSGQPGHRQLCGTMFVSGRDFIIRSLKSTASPLQNGRHPDSGDQATEFVFGLQKW